MTVSIENGVELGMGKRNCAGIGSDVMEAGFKDPDATARHMAYRICAACTARGTLPVGPNDLTKIAEGLEEDRGYLGEKCHTPENSAGVR